MLILSSNSVHQALVAIYDELYGFYGPQHWWPTQTGSQWEIMVGAVLTQRTSWRNAALALDNVAAAWGNNGLVDPQFMLDASDSDLREVLRPAGHYQSKPRKLRGLARFVLDVGGIDRLTHSEEETVVLRGRLLQVWGIGPETADAILLYALKRPTFVADAYALRLASRWGLLQPDASYEVIQKLFMDNLPHDVSLFNEYHALMVQHGKQLCQPRPICVACPLNRRLLLDVKQTEDTAWRCPKLYIT